MQWWDSSGLHEQLCESAAAAAAAAAVVVIVAAAASMSLRDFKRHKLQIGSGGLG